MVPGLKKSPECAENKERVQGFGRSPCGTRGGGERREAPIPLPDYQSPPTTHYVTKKQQVLSKSFTYVECDSRALEHTSRRKRMNEKSLKEFNLGMDITRREMNFSWNSKSA